LFNLGGLHSQDQSRSRLRTSFVLRLTFFKCRDYPSRQDQLFFFLVKIFQIEIFQSRFIFIEIFIEIFETNRDCQDFWDFWDLSRLFKIYWDILTLSRLFEVLQDQKSRQIKKSWSRNVIKLTNSRSRSRQAVKICQKCHVSTDFSISIKTFGTVRWCWDKIEISQSWSRYLDRWD
jgi:hypothetical protein